MYYKKRRKKKKPPTEFVHGYDTFAGFHIYRSTDKDAPFSEWTRMTERPRISRKFQDYFDKDDFTNCYYKITEVDIFGNESEPRDPERVIGIRDGKGFVRTPANTIIGVNCYWSEDPDLPLDQWKKLNDEVLKEQKCNFKCPIKTPFYMYAKYVNELGNEFGQPSDLQRIVPKE